MQNTEISELRNKTNSLKEQKEILYKGQDEIRKKIREEADKIRELKSESDKTSIELDNLRKARDNENIKVKELISNIKSLREKKKLILQKHNIKEPEKAYGRIESLEKRVETEALSPSQEKKLMKQINDLKKIFGKNSELGKIIKDIKEISGKLNESKKRGDEYHKKLREVKKIRGYKKFREALKDISELRKKQNWAYNKFSEVKKEYLDANSELKNKLREFNKERKIERQIKQKEKENFDSLNVIKIHDLARKVEDKLKKRQKITTDDLLAFQGEK